MTARKKKGNRDKKMNPLMIARESVTKRKRKLPPLRQKLFVGVFVLAFAAIGITLLVQSRAAVPLHSVKSGNWSDPSVWGGRVPGGNDIATLAAGHTVTFDDNSTRVAGVRVNAGGSLKFKPNQSVTLESTENIVVEGELEMRPANASIKHTLRFVGVNESAFIGGGMDPLPSDKGLWVMGAGQLDIAGTPKTSWTRASGAISQGATSVALDTTPSGWAAGDELTISPTESPAVGAASYTGFDEASVTSVSGNTVNLSRGTSRAHPRVNNTWTAEVMNLSRNVQLEGTASGRAHIFIRSSKPQTVNYAAIRWMGANKVYSEGKPHTEAVGRYSLHFHHSMDGSRGSMVEGTVVRDGGGRSFVPHRSNGITFRNTIAYNTWRPAYWYDSQEESHDIFLDGTIAAKTQFTEDTKFRMSAYMHDTGQGNTIRNAVSTGMVACSCDDEAAGYVWPEISDDGEHSGVWDWRDSIAHNNSGNGLFLWQNTGVHTVINYVGYYNNRYGVRHGAYTNSYKFVGGAMYGNKVGALELKAVHTLSYENMLWDGAGLSTHLFKSIGGQGESTQPVQLKNITMRGFTERAIWMARPPTTAEGRDHSDRVDVINSNITGNPFYLENGISSTSRIRFQNGSTAYELRRADQSGGTYVSAMNAKRYDNVPRIPLLAFTSPTTTRTTVSPGVITFNVNVTPGSNPVQRVEFFRDGSLISTDSSAPYSFTYDTRSLRQPLGSATYQVRAVDTAGVLSHLDGINVRAVTTPPPVPEPDEPDPIPDPPPPPPPPADTTAPNVSITAPANNATVNSTLNVTANASDNVGVTKVEFYLDNALKRTDTSPSYTYSFDTTGVSNGQHALLAKAYDAAGNTRSSSTVTVNVNNQTSTPPPPPPTSAKEDINQDGKVNLLDFSLLAAKFGQTGSNLGRVDINGDNRVNLLDFSLLAAKFGQ